jgi:DNA-binding response OmpR family regulator
MIEVNELMKQSHTMSILYVEDDVDIREEMCEILEDFFRVVILAKDGEDGFSKFVQYKRETGNYPDIIITDLMMPISDGIEMSKKILTRNFEQLIIFLSACHESDHMIELINMGIEYYLEKPVEPMQLLLALQQVIIKYNTK